MCRQAEAAIRRFEEQTDILIVVSNDKLLDLVDAASNPRPSPTPDSASPRGLQPYYLTLPYLCP